MIPRPQDDDNVGFYAAGGYVADLNMAARLRRLAAERAVRETARLAAVRRERAA